MPNIVWKDKGAKLGEILKDKDIEGAVMEATSPKIASAFVKQLHGGKKQLETFLLSLVESTKAGQAAGGNFKAMAEAAKKEMPKFEYWIECPSNKKAILKVKNSEGTVIILDSIG